MYIHIYIYTLHLGRKLQPAVEIFIDDCPLPLLTFLTLVGRPSRIGLLAIYPIFLVNADQKKS